LWTEAVRLAPEKARPKRQLARHVEPRQAVALLEQARALEPDNLETADELGRAHLALGQPEIALAEFGRVLGRKPDDPAARNNRGVALAALAQTEAAKADFHGALQRDPCFFDARMNLARLGERLEPPPGCRWSRRQRAQWDAQR
jgi:Flp pilus assembly protein TadD